MTDPITLELMVRAADRSAHYRDAGDDSTTREDASDHYVTAALLSDLGVEIERLLTEIERLEGDVGVA